ncbi:hypothetical protein HY490_01840 [Candidatus Woesearchaeota archaeon]|nr:hypothetical protein [Candidatus Woesearchaeota archaeon]
MKAQKPVSAGRADLTHQEDLAIGVMNLISLEEHLAMTSAKTNKQEYVHVLGAVRKLRVKLLRKLVTNTEGELWCISKHLLAGTMRLMEVATKYVESDPGAAHDFEKSAFDLYSLFWLLQTPDKEKKESQKTQESDVVAKEEVK